MDKGAVLTHFLNSKGVPTCLGGELPASVLNSSKYVPLIAAAAEDDNPPSLDHAIHTALSAESKCVALIGPEGSGKTTALQKLVMDWAKGEQLQHFSYVFYFHFWEMNSLEGALSLETLIQRSQYRVPPETVNLVAERPETVLFVFDGLDQYKHNLDPSVHTICSDPDQVVPVSCLVASLLHRSLLRGAAFVVATRPTENLKFLPGTQVEALGFLKPQRKAYFNNFFTDPAAANKALLHMERTLGFYDFCASPRFCWTVCSVYKSLMDLSADLPKTLSQLFADILVHLIQNLSLSEARNRALVLALGRMASHCFLDPHSSCTKEQVDSFGFEQFLNTSDVFLRKDGELELNNCAFSFHSQLIQEFILALAFFLDKSTYEDVEKMLEKHEGSAMFLEFFLSGLSEQVQYRRLETLLGEFDSDRIKDVRCWLISSSKKTLKGYMKENHYRCFHILQQAQNESLVKEMGIHPGQLGYGHNNLSLKDCVTLNYIITCLGGINAFDLRNTTILPDKAEVLASIFSQVKKISLTDNTFSAEVIHHLASALSRGVANDLFLSRCHLSPDIFKSLCAGLKESKLQQLNIEVCKLTEAYCEDLVSVLTSETSQLGWLDLRFNPIRDDGLVKLCTALYSPRCRLQELSMQRCDLTSASMEAFARALCSDQSQLIKAELRGNSIGDSGVEALCKALQHPVCKLHSLILFDNELTGACCSSLKEAFMSEHFSLTELNLAVNELGQEGGLLLCQGLSRRGCPIERLDLTRCELTPRVFEELGSLLKSGTSRLKALIMGINEVGDHGVKPLWDAVAHPSCLLEELDLELTGLTDACIDDLCAAIRGSKTLKHLELRNNMLSDASIPALIQVVEASDNLQELCLRYNDISEEFLSSCDKIIF
ncbi:NACHT, LRR and PYD domains-containing protein 14 [Cololabis saira]|uniref:NACHT, LRR and PYD domains-containing protein 14 n=1 Tax=Cololabis saira TaxID=129043 RepID=UPI002AD26DE7|nr:NACHT, LRR and PYD domains-containing protein 14 [Cololabis saira]